jgi:outer membrane protein assembly factor BamB
VSSPALHGDVLYVGSGGTRPGQRGGSLHAVDHHRGRERWRLPIEAGFHGAPAVAGKRVYAGSRNGRLYAVDAAAGQITWTLPTGSDIVATPAVAGGLVFIAAGPTLYAVAATSGRCRWQHATGHMLLGATPAVVGDMVFLGGTDGVFYALDRESGRLRWSVTGDTAAEAEGEHFGAPLVAAGVVYTGCSDGHLYALDATTGAPLWSLATPLTLWRTPAIAGDVLFAPGCHQRALFAFA